MRDTFFLMKIKSNKNGNLPEKTNKNWPIDNIYNVFDHSFFVRSSRCLDMELQCRPFSWTGFSTCTLNVSSSMYWAHLQARLWYVRSQWDCRRIVAWIWLMKMPLKPWQLWNNANEILVNRFGHDWPWSGSWGHGIYLALFSYPFLRKTKGKLGCFSLSLHNSWVT